jgi:hypothetical protein
MTSVTENTTKLTRARQVPLALHVLAAPFIYGVVAPIALLDVMVSLYQAVCFRIWSIPQTKRSPFLCFDRARLAVLNPLQRLNCVYCSYANGILAYATEIASKTEQYWCPIKHESEPAGVHKRYRAFARYDGNPEDLAAHWRALREQLGREHE